MSQYYWHFSAANSDGIPCLGYGGMDFAAALDATQTMEKE